MQIDRHSNVIGQPPRPAWNLGFAHDARACGAGMPRPEIAVFGEWNTTNLGDRAIHAGVLRFVEDCGWRARSYALGSLTPVAAGAGAGIGPAASGKATAMLSGMPGLKRALRECRQRVRMRALLPQLGNAQAIMVGGGELLSDEDLHFPQSLSAVAAAARKLDKPLLCLGCSVEGKWSQRGARIVRDFLAACALVAPRDELTAARIAAVLGRPVPVFGDFCLNEAWTANGGGWHAGRHIVAINVRELPAPWHSAQPQYEANLAALTRHLIDTGRARGVTRAKIFATSPAEDAAAARRVCARLEGCDVEVEMPQSLGQLTRLLRASALVVASRLHAAILALAAGAAVVGYTAQPKLHHFLASMGIGQYGFDLEDGMRLLGLVDQCGNEALFEQQRRQIMHSPIWACRAEVRAALAALVAGNPQAAPSLAQPAPEPGL